MYLWFGELETFYNVKRLTVIIRLRRNDLVDGVAFGWVDFDETTKFSSVLVFGRYLHVAH